MDGNFSKESKVGIVGAGPGGLYLCYLLGHSGFNVLLFDPSPEREKPCGGGITFRGLELLKEIFGSELPTHNTVNHVKIMSPGREWLKVNLSPPLSIFSRKLLNKKLLERSVNSNTEFREEKVHQIKKDSKWNIITQNRSYEVDFLVGADGATSLVRRKLWNKFTSNHISIGAGYYLYPETLIKDSDSIHIIFIPDFPGYIWIFPRTDCLSAGICCKANLYNVKKLYEMLDRELKQLMDYSSLEIKIPFKAMIPGLEPQSLDKNIIGGSDWALIGDASGLVDPITREGIYFALKTAKLLSSCLMKNSPELYPLLWNNMLSVDFIKADGLSKIFYNSGFIEEMIFLCSKNRNIKNVLSNLFSGTLNYRTLKKRLIFSSLPNIFLILKWLKKLK